MPSRWTAATPYVDGQIVDIRLPGVLGFSEADGKPVAKRTTSGALALPEQDEVSMLNGD
jgi:hypothetical protein